MSEKKTYLLTAKEARKIADESNCQLNRLAKEIEYAAKENRNHIHWCVYETTPACIEKLYDTLHENGYSVIKLHEDSRHENVITSLDIIW